VVRLPGGGSLYSCSDLSSFLEVAELGLVANVLAASIRF